MELGDTMMAQTDTHAADPHRLELERILAAAARYLPTQGPIGVFVAQNILQGFEDEPFEDAVVHASRMFGTEPFLPESQYRLELSRGRIRVSDIDAVLDQEASRRSETGLAGGRVPLRSLHRALLLHPVRQESDAAVRWTLTESDVLERLRDDLPPEMRWRLLSEGGTSAAARSDGLLSDVEDETARRATLDRAAALMQQDGERRASSELWHACVEAVALTRPSVVHARPPVRHRDLILAVDPALDTDALVHPFLIRVCGAFLDQGVAAWPMPDRDRGLLAAAVALYGLPLGPTQPWSAALAPALHEAAALPAAECVVRELDTLGVPAEHREQFITRSLLALRGWAGMIRQFEERPDRAPVAAVPARLLDFLALRLVCDRVATQWAAGRLVGRRRQGRGPDRDLGELWAELRDRYPAKRGPGSLARAFLLHQVSQLVGLTGRDINGLDEDDLLQLERSIASFDSTTRRRLFHLAYERRHRIEVLDALASHTDSAPRPRGERPVAQAIFCMDERCESFRRHFEELGLAYETFGTAGFFAVPMYYQGIDDWHSTPLCPIVMRPSHKVTEVPVDDALATHRLRQSVRRGLGQLFGSMSSGSRTLFRGGLLTAIGGALAAVPLVARVLFPRLTANLTRRAADLTRQRIPTRLALERRGDARLADGTCVGFEIGEMAGIVRRVLEDVGLTAGMSRLVAIIGHGSTSLNNPHESAYDCGACGGGRGGPNARAFAMMANEQRVRAALRAEGLVIPDDTVFVGGMQDTCSDSIVFFDRDRVPESHRRDFELFHAACDWSREHDAKERCRRFESVPLGVTPGEALQAVEGRANDLAQARPEYGHATNAVCVIGRRWRTRGLFLDRRAFLVSYDPHQDPTCGILARTLAAVGPVGSGINLAYLFSRVDPIGYGCGTKLPHNITGLIGVMDGHASDLRTGLPWQTVEIHEPVRLLLVIDATPAAILRATEDLPVVKRLVANRWVQVASWDPDSGSLAVLEDGRFVPYQPERTAVPIVDRSSNWFAGHRGNLPPARVLAALTPVSSLQPSGQP